MCCVKLCGRFVLGSCRERQLVLLFVLEVVVHGLRGCAVAEC
jgi:hypothetical protein